MLAAVERGQVEAEHVDAAQGVAQLLIGDGAEARAAQRAIEQLELVVIDLGVDVALVAILERRAQAGLHVPELLAPRLVHGARAGMRRDLGQPFAIERERGLEIGDRAACPQRRHREGAAERDDVVEVAIDHRDALAGECGAGDGSGDVRVAIAVAADPGAPAQERGQVPRAAEARGEAILDRAVDPGRDVEQRAAEHLERVLDLVDRRRPAGASVLGRVECEDLRGEARLGARAAGGVELAEDRGDPAEVIERRPAAGLRGVRGDHRHHEGAVEQRAQIRGRRAGIDHAVDRRGEAIGRVIAASAQHAETLALLGDVHQVAPQPVGAGDLLELAARQVTDLFGERAPPAREVAAAQLARREAEAPAQLERAGAAERGDRGPQRVRQPRDVAIEQRGIVHERVVDDSVGPCSHPRTRSAYACATRGSMKRRSSALLIAAAVLLIAGLVVVKRSLGEVDAPPAESAPASRTSSAAPAASEPAAVVAPATPATAVAPSGPSPTSHSTAVSPSSPSLPAVVAEYVPQKKLPPIASKQTLREQELAVTPKLAECAAHAGAKITGSATLTFILAHEGDKAVVETTGVDYDATTITDEPLLECLRETAREMTFQPVPDSSAIYVTRNVELDHGKLVGNKFVNFSYSR